jgi:hypothetical protein
VEQQKATAHPPPTSQPTRNQGANGPVPGRARTSLRFKIQDLWRRWKEAKCTGLRSTLASILPIRLETSRSINEYLQNKAYCIEKVQANYRRPHIVSSCDSTATAVLICMTQTREPRKHCLACQCVVREPFANPICWIKCVL